MVCAVVIAMMLLIIFAGTDFFAVDVERYVLVILLLLCQMMAKTGLYETIQVKKLKKGMILSSYTSMLLQNSRVRGLPGVSMEDLRNRLSETEVASVKRWAASRKVEEIVVVKKIPFAIFLLMGFATYFIVWSLLI
jgi:preflagellin peptidase FlaK